MARTRVAKATAAVCVRDLAGKIRTGFIFEKLSVCLARGFRSSSKKVEELELKQTTDLKELPR